MHVVLKAVQNSLFKRTNGFNFTHRIPRCVGFGNCLDSFVISDGSYKVFFKKNSLGNSRLGIIAPKKILPRAVDRNSAKRKIRQLFRVHNIKYIGVDLVVMVRGHFQVNHASRIGGLNKLFNRIETQCEVS